MAQSPQVATDVRTLIRDAVRRALERHLGTPPISITPETEKLFGLPVYVFGEGFVGYYVDHSTYFDSVGVEWWDMRTGFFDVVAVVSIAGMEIPIVIGAGGLPTVGAIVLNRLLSAGAQLRGVYLHGSLDVYRLRLRRDQIINLQRVLEGRDQIIVCDPYGVLSGAAPDDVVRLKKMVHYVTIQNQFIRSAYDRCMISVDQLLTENEHLRNLAHTLIARYRSVRQSLDEIKLEVERLRQDLAFYEQKALISERVAAQMRLHIESLVDHLQKTIDHLTDLSFLSHDIAKHGVEELRRELEELRKATARKIEETEKKAREAEAETRSGGGGAEY